MKKEDAVNKLMEVVGESTLTGVTGAIVGCLSLIDEIASNFTDEVREKHARMFRDNLYYLQRGGWLKFTLDENRQYLERAIDVIEDKGYEVDSLDFYDDTNGVLFLNLIEKIV